MKFFPSKEVKELFTGAGIGNGLRITLDLHSNFQSFGTVTSDYNAFRVFIGQPSEFPTLTSRSLLFQPGNEHFVDLSITQLSSSGIVDI